MPKMKALSFTIKKVMVKVKGFFSIVGQRSQVQNLWYHWMQNMKDLSVRVKKLWLMLKFFDGQTERQTDGQTDRVITIGHPRGPNERRVKILEILRDIRDDSVIS